MPPSVVYATLSHRLAWNRWISGEFIKSSLLSISQGTPQATFTHSSQKPFKDHSEQPNPSNQIHPTIQPTKIIQNIQNQPKPSKTSNQANRDNTILAPHRGVNHRVLHVFPRRPLPLPRPWPESTPLVGDLRGVRLQSDRRVASFRAMAKDASVFVLLKVSNHFFFFFNIVECHVYTRRLESMSDKIDCQIR